MGACRRLTHIAADAVTVRPGTVAAVTPPPGTAPGKAVTLQFHDNTLLPLLLGDHDRHLARIEQAMGVRLSCRGNRLAISGDAMRVDAVQAVLQGLWQKLERGQAVGRPEVEAAIKLADLDADPRLPLSDLPAIRTRRGAVGPRSPGQATYIEALARHEMVFGIGPAGTGKTYLAVAQAVAMLQAGRVDRIVLSRPAVEAGERLGFLPGDMKEKVDPYLRPLYDALNDMMPGEQVIRRLGSGEIEVAPLAFMRGRTLAHAYVILDEAQNTTAMQMKMFLTRMGEGTRMVVTGDPSQIDLPPGTRSGLIDALETLEGVAGINIVRFDKRDVVRHPLVARIVDAYDQRETAAGDTRREGARRARPAPSPGPVAQAGRIQSGGTQVGGIQAGGTPLAGAATQAMVGNGPGGK
jgi:phosphate starvation-inducible PhoH-like protein